VAELLEGMRVLDLSSWRPMAQATQILADLGAEVLKVEPPGGDPMRAYPEIFASVARGKRSVVVDLGREEGRRRALGLAAQADVVCEGWRPGVADRLGVGYEAVRQANPAVIYCSLNGYGAGGPLSHLPGHDVNFQALGGALAPEEGRPPEVPRLPVADLEGASVCAVAICAAWARRLARGVGERIEVAMADAVSWWVGTRSRPAGGGRRAHPSPGYGLFATADGRFVALGVLSEDRLWRALCQALGLEDLAAMSFEQRRAASEEVNRRLASRLSSLASREALARLAARGVPVSPVLSPEEAAEHPHFLGRQLHVDTEAGRVARFPARWPSMGPPRTELPEPGAHPEGFSGARPPT